GDAQISGGGKTTANETGSGVGSNPGGNNSGGKKGGALPLPKRPGGNNGNNGNNSSPIVPAKKASISSFSASVAAKFTGPVTARLIEEFVPAPAFAETLEVLRKGSSGNGSALNLRPGALTIERVKQADSECRPGEGCFNISFDAGNANVFKDAQATITLNILLSDGARREVSRRVSLSAGRVRLPIIPENRLTLISSVQVRFEAQAVIKDTIRASS